MTKLYLIPGTGTDRRMFAPQFDAFPDAIVPDWLPPLERKEPLAAYARRLATTVDTSAPFILGGVSLGGMIAQEMALVLKPEMVLVISSCSTSKAIPWYWRLHGRLTRALPDGVIRFQFKTMGKLTRKLDARRVPRKELYAGMLEEMPPQLVRWQSGAATEWRLSGALTMPVFQLHGAKDKIVPVKNVKPNQVVQEGGHLINMTHAGEVNAVIAELLAWAAASKAA